MTILRFFAAVAALCLAATPALAQRHTGHADRAEEDYVRGDVIETAMEELRAGDPEALETCAELVVFIQETRWRTPGEVANDLAWAESCARGEKFPPKGPPPLSRDGAVAYVEMLLKQALEKIAHLRTMVPYDGKKDPDKVLYAAQGAGLECWKATEEAEERGDGAVGLVQYCRGMALMVEDSTIKPPKHFYACAYFRRARADFDSRDINASPFRDMIQAALPEIDAQLATPGCVKDAK